MGDNTLHWADYLVFGLFLVVSLGIGVYHGLTGGRQRTTGEFLLANRKLKVIPTMLSLLVSFQSAIMILGHAAEMYTRGITAWPMGLLGLIIAIIIAERFFCPWMYPLKLTSVYQFLEMRFASKLVRSIGAGLGIFSGILYMGLAMYAPSIALQAATGFPVTASIPIMAVVCTMYTAVGGMRAVIWTDVFQFGIMLFGMLAILIRATVAVGGLTEVFDLFDQEGRLEWPSFSPDPRVRHTFWGLTFCWGLAWSFTYGISQPSIQRYAATPTEKEARLILLTNIPPLIVMTSVAFLTGVAMLAYYAMIKCDPLASGQVKNQNQILAHLVVTLYADYHGFSGLFLATLYSGALSSVSSTLTATAAIMWEDVFKWKLGHRLSDYQAAVLNKCVVVAYGAVSTGIAFLCVKIPGPITQVAISMMGAVGGPTFGLFLLGGLKCFKIANWKGASVGVMTSFIFMLWISFGAQSLRGHQPPLPPVSTANCSSVPIHTSNDTFSTSYPSIPEVIDKGSHINDILHTTQHAAHNYSTTELPLDPMASLKGVENLYAVSYVWYSPIGLLITIIIGLLVSLITNKILPEEQLELPDSLFIPVHKACSWTSQEDDNRDFKEVKSQKELNGLTEPFLSEKEKINSDINRNETTV